MTGILVRGRGWRRRGEGDNLVRSRQKFGHRVPPIPWQGDIFRFMSPVEVSDYESVATGSWSTGSFKTTFNRPTPITFGGASWDVYYHILSVPLEESSDVEVILPPLRYSFDETSTSGGNFDYMQWGGITFTTIATSNSGSLLTLPKLLPSSGNSHVSSGKPTTIGLLTDHKACQRHIFYSAGHWTPTTFITPLPTPYNYGLMPRYMQLRLNGVAVGSLIDCQDWIDDTGAYIDAVNGTSGALPKQSFTGYFPSNPLYNKTPFVLDIPDELTFADGDTFEIDIWWWLAARPLLSGGSPVPGSGTGQKYVISSIGRQITTSGVRVDTGPTGTPVTNYEPGATHVLRLSGLKMNDGFDPEADTYTLTFNGINLWYPGNGSSGARKVETGSGWTLNRIDSRGFYWTGIVQTGTYAGRTATILASWDQEICLVTMTLSGAGTRYFRPQNSGDYETTINDRVQGGTVYGPCGVFNGLGSTTFGQWTGAQDAMSLPSVNANFPATFTMTKVAA